MGSLSTDTSEVSVRGTVSICETYTILGQDCGLGFEALRIVVCHIQINRGDRALDRKHTLEQSTESDILNQDMGFSEVVCLRIAKLQHIEEPRHAKA